MKQEKNVQSMLKVLDYTKTNKKWFDEKELVAGYHTVSILGEKVKGQRDPEIRLAKVDYDFFNKRVFDVGCSNGGLLHTLSEDIKFGVGVDFNVKCVNAANALKAINHRDNIHFYTFDLDKENLSMLNHFIFGEPVDICFFFNISLWVKRWKDVFTLCSDLTTTMLFEAHGSDKQQAEQLNFVKSIYADVQLLSEQSDDDPTYAKRKMYICDSRVVRSVAPEALFNADFLKDYSENAVTDVYEQAFSGERVESVHFYPNTHESVVAEINEDYILKLPRPHRGVTGLKAEQSITDFVRNKIQLPIPTMSIHSQPVVFARYRKLPGKTFNKSQYASLPDRDKEILANQLAHFIADIHTITPAQVEKADIVLSPSWDLSTTLIEDQLGSDKDPVIGALLKEVVNNHNALNVPEENQVFGHFDLHGGNLLVNAACNNIEAVIDFGNCKLGDLHQDLSVMNLSSPDLAARIAITYEKITKRKLNRLLVQHYTTIFYLNLLAGLKRKKTDEKYNYWLGELYKWYNHLLTDRATVKLNDRKPITSMSSGWRKWIASNLMKGSSPEGLQKILWEKGLSHVETATEIQLAMSHPYVKAGQEIFHTLDKRNWLLKTCNTLAAMDPRYSDQLEVCETPNFESFIKNYYSKHLPVVLKNGVNHWPALKKWTPDYLLKHYGNKEVEVQAGREDDPLYERNAGKHKKRMKMSAFVELIQKGDESNDYYMTANNTKNSLSSIGELFNDIGDFGNGYRKMDGEKNGAFFWFGPKGTFTPIHHDLTNNMFVQIYGRKKVTLISALQVPLLYNDKGVFSAAEYPNFDEQRHPQMKNITPMEIVVEPGDALFIPIGWWHCVEALDVSMSISFTNFNLLNQFSNDFPRG